MMRGLSIERKQERPNEPFIDIFHRGLLVLVLVLVIGGAPGGRALPLIYRCKIVQTQSRGSVLRPRRRSLLQLREVLH